MSFRMQRLAGAVALVAAIGLAAGACGSSSTDMGSGNGSSTTSAASAGSTMPPGSTPTAMGAVDIVVISTPYGDALGTSDGLALYTWDEEADGTIKCVQAQCLETWPPVLATEVGDTGDLDAMRVTLVDRPDSGKQVALDGKPLYHMAADGPGEANCQGTSGWWIINPDGTKNTNETERSSSDGQSSTTQDLPGY